MFGEVVLQGESHEGLRIPADAVIESGTQTVVFVALGEGKFQPREVKLGTGDGAVRRGGRRARRRRRGRHARELPHRLRVAPARLSRGTVIGRSERPARRPPRAAGHDQAHHPLLGREPGSRHRRDGHRVDRRRLGDAHHPARRAARPLRHPGDRLLALGSQPRHPRGPGHLPDHHGAARRAQGQGDPRLLRLRLQLRLRHLRGRHRHVLGAHARARVPLEDHLAAPRGREDRARAGRVERGLGLPVRPRRPQRQALLRRAPLVPGLVSPLRDPERSGRGGGGHGRRPGAPVPGHRQPERARRLQAAARRPSFRRSGAGTTTSAGGWSSSPAASTWCAAAAT